MLPAVLEDRFWTLVDRNEDCWVWTGPVDQHGYGSTTWHVNGEMFRIKAHRVAWELANGRPAQDCVCHRCDNPSCVNPTHLFVGSQAENLADMRTKGRGAKGERHGHSRLSVVDVRTIRSLAGKLTQQAIAARFGVSREHVRDILLGKRWAHV